MDDGCRYRTDGELIHILYQPDDLGLSADCII